MIFFLFESNVRSNQIYSHLSIHGHELHLSGTPFSRTACYIRSDIGQSSKISSGEGNEVVTVEWKDYMLLGVYRPFKVESGSSISIQFDNIIKHLDSKIIAADRG
jgi:hypothetical protein